jgi:hypothetical protein
LGAGVAPASEPPRRPDGGVPWPGLKIIPGGVLILPVIPSQLDQSLELINVREEEAE